MYLDMMMKSPSRRLLHEALLYFYPFGNTRVKNALDGYISNDEPSDDHILKVLFLGCGDLRNPLAAATSSCHKGHMHIHINDLSLSVVARDILILKVISSENFDPANQEDMSYIWDLWYNATWPESTLNRFKKDIRGLLDEPNLQDNIVIPKKDYQEDLRDIWTQWLAFIKTRPAKDVLAERANFMVKNWTLVHRRQDPTVKEMSFTQVVDQAVSHHQHGMLNDMTYLTANAKTSGTQLTAGIKKEFKSFFETGNCSGRKAPHANPTFLQPDTGKWIVHYAACPLDGYQPLPKKALDGTAFAYCRNELKKLLIAFRKRMDHLKFIFHPCDALALCYEESLDEFDVIDSSNLSDHVGLVNLVNAGARKLRSDHSVLITESMLWNAAAPDVAQYVQEMLCCPLSLIPTLYGLRLADDVELGPDSIGSVGALRGCPTRIRWMKTLPLKGASLSLSSALQKPLDHLRRFCFTPSLILTSGGIDRCGRPYYSPLTYRYVLSDLIHRTGIPMESSFFAGLPPVFRKSLETTQAWMEHQPVWQVKVRIHFGPIEQMLYDRLSHTPGTPALRLLLMPQDRYNMTVPGGLAGTQAAFGDVNSTVNHFVDNLGLAMKMMPGGEGIDWVDVSFLVKDRNLVESHCGLVMDQDNNWPVFIIGPFSARETRVESFDQPYPWKNPSVDRVRSSIVAQSCQESEGGYVIRLKVQSESGQTPSGLKVKTDEEWPCDSAHRITVSLDGIEPLTITLPHPILPDTLKATLHRKDGVVDLVMSKGLKSLWPADVVHPEGSRWNAEEDFQPMTDLDSISIHLAAQFPKDHIQKPSVGIVYDPVTQVREAVKYLFFSVVQNGEDLFQVKVGGSIQADWFLRAHLPIRLNHQGTPIVLLTAMDHQLAEKLLDEGKIKEDRSLEEFRGIFGSPKELTTLTLHTAEGLRLFRYILRLNSAKIRLTSWQRKNLPKGGESGRPWLATFLRPLYREGLNITGVLPAPTFCRNCREKKENLRRCGRCKTVAYCSVECQRGHWTEHKAVCFKI